MSRTDHQHIQELLGAYALDAIGEDERALIEEHLKTCRTCPEEVAEHREVVTALIAAGQPPSGVWDRIFSSLEETPPRLRLVAEKPPVRRPLLLAAEALVVVAVLALAYKVADQDRQIDRLAASEERQSTAAFAYETLTDATAKTVVLRSTDGKTQAQLVIASSGRGLLIATELPILAAGETYQLWALVGDAKISAGLLGSQPKVSLFTFKGDPDGFAITKEPADGSPQPTSDPVAFGTLG